MNIPLDTDNEDQLGLLGNVEGTGLAALASKADLLALSIAVLLDVRLGTLEDDTTLFLVGLWIFCQHKAQLDGQTSMKGYIGCQSRKMVNKATASTLV